MRIRFSHLLMAVWALTPRAALAQAATNGVPPLATGGTNAPAAAFSYETDPAFQRFSALIEHSPFMPPASMAPAGASPVEGAGFASALRLTGFFIRGNTVEASIEDKSEADKKYFVHSGDIIGESEVKVVGFDLQGRAVLLQKGEEQARLEYESEAAPPPQAATARPPGSPPPPSGPGSGGPRPPPSQPVAQSSGGGGEDANGRLMRRRNRQQTIERLRGMLSSTADPATQERLRNMITMLERAEAQDAATEGGR